LSGSRRCSLCACGIEKRTSKSSDARCDKRQTHPPSNV
jgi:hypothetical protein